LERFLVQQAASLATAHADDEQRSAAMLKKLMGLFSRKTLLPYEQLCLEAWCDSLPEAAKKVLRQQLEDVCLVQHQAEGSKVCFYYRDATSCRLFHPLSPVLHVATVVLQPPSGSDAQVMRVKVYVHRGRFFSLEFPKRPERYALQHKLTLNDLQVARVDAHEMITPSSD